MHPEFYFSKPAEAYNYDYSSDRAIWVIALVNYWVTHAFKIANCNGFHFNACPLGLSPNGTLCLSMMMYDPRTALYIHSYEDIHLFADIDAQILYFLFSLMDTFSICMIVVIWAVTVFLNLYIHSNEDIHLFADIDAQILYFLFSLMDTFSICMIVVIWAVTVFLNLYIHPVYNPIISFDAYPGCYIPPTWIPFFCSSDSKLLKCITFSLYHMEECGILFFHFSYLCTYNTFLYSIKV